MATNPGAIAEPATLDPAIAAKAAQWAATNLALLEIASSGHARGTKKQVVRIVERVAPTRPRRVSQRGRAGARVKARA